MTATSKEAAAKKLRPIVDQVTQKIEDSDSGQETFAVRNATLIDARAIVPRAWVIVSNRRIVAAGHEAEFADSPDAAVGEQRLTDALRDHHVPNSAVIDAQGRILTPGFIDTHSHGAWFQSFDNGPDAVRTVRAGHLMHGTTRQIVSLITNPLDQMCDTLRDLRPLVAQRPDILGVHLEGPFISPLHKGAHDPACLRDPLPTMVSSLLEAAGNTGSTGSDAEGDGAVAPRYRGILRQITIAPELEHGLQAIASFARGGVLPAVGHTDCDDETANRAFDAGARILTHIYDAMNGIHHRAPGPILAAWKDPRVEIELINDGFHVQTPAAQLAFMMAGHRLALVTDSMEATDCPDGRYKLGKLDVTVRDTHARLVSNGAIAGSTLTLEAAVRRAVTVLGIPPQRAVEAATLAPARTYGLDRSNPITGAPLGLLAPGYAADLVLLGHDWRVRSVWADGRRIR